MSNTTPSIAQLQRAIQIQEQITTLEAELKAVLGGVAVVAPAKSSAVAKLGKVKRTMSPATIAKMRASQQARWAVKNGSTTSSAATTPAAVESDSATKAAKAPKKKSGLTAEGRAQLSAKMKARWAARKKGAPALNAKK